MADILNHIPAPLKSLWDIETELRIAAQNALFMRNDEAKRHLDEARRHLGDALKSIQTSPEVQTPKPNSDVPGQP